MVSHDRTAPAGLDGQGHQLDQKHLPECEYTVRDLNYQLKQLCHRNRDGSYATQAKRMHHLMLIAYQLYDLGFRGIKPRSLKQNHVDALVKDWLRQELVVGTIKNRMAVLRWWAEKADRRNVVARSNAYYGIPDRQFVTNTSKAKEVSAQDLEGISDPHVRMSLELQQAFGLRREEAIKFIPDYADRRDHIVLKESWTKGGKERIVPVLPAATQAVAAYAELCPFDLAPGAPLFVGARGGSDRSADAIALLEELVDAVKPDEPGGSGHEDGGVGVVFGHRASASIVHGRERCAR